MTALSESYAEERTGYNQIKMLGVIVEIYFIPANCYAFTCKKAMCYSSSGVFTPYKAENTLVLISAIQSFGYGPFFKSWDIRLKLPSLDHFISSFLISINSETSPECSVCPFSTYVPWICFCKTKEFCLSEREVHRKWIRRCHWSYTGWRGWQLLSR